MIVKNGVDLTGLKPEILVGLMVLESNIGKGVVITCGRNGTHIPGSLHYAGLAVDIRKPDAVISTIRSYLGPQFDLVEEVDHWHLEYQPKV